MKNSQTMANEKDAKILSHIFFSDSRTKFLGSPSLFEWFCIHEVFSFLLWSPFLYSEFLCAFIPLYLLYQGVLYCGNTFRSLSSCLFKLLHVLEFFPVWSFHKIRVLSYFSNFTSTRSFPVRMLSYYGASMFRPFLSSSF
jgi:hypothetical protein